jgi:hypothetical protein
MAFSGAMFIDDNDAVAVANMAQGTQAHERLQKLINDNCHVCRKQKKKTIVN